jgi:hypothetical protein
MQQLIQLLVGSLVIFLVAMWSIPSLRRSLAARRRESLVRARRVNTAAVVSRHRSVSTAESRDLVRELDQVAAAVVDLCPARVMAMPDGGGPQSPRRLGIYMPRRGQPACPRIEVRLPPRSEYTRASVDRVSLLATPTDPALIEAELVDLDRSETGTIELVDAIVVEQPGSSPPGDALPNELRGILPERQPGATPPAGDRIELDERFLSELLGPTVGAGALPDVLMTSPAAQAELHDVWAGYGSDHDVLVRALQALSDLT